MFARIEVICALRSDHLQSDRLLRRSDHLRLHPRQNVLRLLNNRLTIREANPKDHGKPEPNHGKARLNRGKPELSRDRPEPIRSLDPTGERYTVAIHRKILGRRNNLRTATMASGLPSVIRTPARS
jgi:hypothetical protein